MPVSRQKTQMLRQVFITKKNPQAPQVKKFKYSIFLLIENLERQATAAEHNAITNRKDETISEPGSDPWAIPRMWHSAAKAPLLWMHLPTQSMLREARTSFQNISWAPGTQRWTRLPRTLSIVGKQTRKWKLLNSGWANVGSQRRITSLGMGTPECFREEMIPELIWRMHVGVPRMKRRYRKPSYLERGSEVWEHMRYPGDDKEWFIFKHTV